MLTVHTDGDAQVGSWCLIYTQIILQCKITMTINEKPKSFQDDLSSRWIALQFPFRSRYLAFTDAQVAISNYYSIATQELVLVRL